MRLIDADTLENEFGISDADIIAKEVIRDVPTVDAVPVIRCRECKYRFENNGHSKNGCPIIDANIWMDDDDFCSYGERKEGVE